MQKAQQGLFVKILKVFGSWTRERSRLSFSMSQFHPPKDEPLPRGANVGEISTLVPSFGPSVRMICLAGSRPKHSFEESANTSRGEQQPRMQPRVSGSTPSRVQLIQNVTKS